MFIVSFAVTIASLGNDIIMGPDMSNCEVHGQVELEPPSHWQASDPSRLTSGLTSYHLKVELPGSETNGCLGALVMQLAGYWYRAEWPSSQPTNRRERPQGRP